MNESRGSLLGRCADGPQGFSRLGSHDIVPTGKPDGQTVGGSLVERSDLGQGVSRGRPHRLVAVLQERDERRPPTAWPPFSEQPSARAADTLTVALGSLNRSTSAATMAPSFPPISPRACAAWQRTVSSSSCNKPISLGATTAASVPIRPSARAAWARTAEQGSSRADSSVATASSIGSAGGKAADRFFRHDRPPEHLAEEPALPAKAALDAQRLCGTAQCAHRHDDILPHQPCWGRWRARPTPRPSPRPGGGPVAATTIARTSSFGSRR